ncbi:MAG: YolD-like family protein [Bacilli bacterium]
MRISEGNIFEAMRLVLPEHRGVMAAWMGERSEPGYPALSEDEVANMHYILSQAIAHRTPVRLQLVEAGVYRLLEGVPVYDGRLRVVNAEGDFPVLAERLLRVDEC